MPTVNLTGRERKEDLNQSESRIRGQLTRRGHAMGFMIRALRATCDSLPDWSYPTKKVLFLRVTTKVTI